jgi:hypothetical protein
MDLSQNPYAMQFGQNTDFSNWQKYAGYTNKSTGKFEFGREKAPTSIYSAVPPVPAVPEAVPTDYSIGSGVAPTSTFGIKPAQSFGSDASSFGQPMSLQDAVRLHLGE